MAEINGAIDNHALHMTVSKFAGRFPNRLLVVLTKSDIVDEGVLKRLRDDSVDMTEHDILDNDVRSLQKQHTQAKLQLDNPEISDKKYQQVLSRSRKLRVELNEAKHKLYAHRIDLRNATVIGKLQQKLERYLAKNEKLTILATSAKHYSVHAGTGDRCAPLMSVEMTQIPMLRKKAFETAGPTRFSTFKRYLETMRIFLMGMRKWTEGCAYDDDAELADVAEKLYEGSKFAFAGVIERREEIVQAKLLRLLRAGRSDSREKAATELEAICKWNPQSFYSFFKKYGRHFTPKQDSKRWNENFLRSQTNNILDPAWHEMIEALDISLRQTKSLVAERIKETHDEMLQCQASVRSDTTAISADFKHLENAFLHDCEIEAEKYKERLLTIKMHATKDSSQNYLAIAMKPMYDHGLEDSGKYVVDRLKARMREQFKLKLDDKREPFSVSHTLLESDLMKEERRYIDALADCLKTLTKGLYDQYRSHANHTPETPEEALARKDFKAFFDDHDSELCDLYERVEEILEAGKQE